MNEGTAPTPDKGEGDFELRRPDEAPAEAAPEKPNPSEGPRHDVPPGDVPGSRVLSGDVPGGQAPQDEVPGFAGPQYDVRPGDVPGGEDPQDEVPRADGPRSDVPPGGMSVSGAERDVPVAPAAGEAPKPLHDPDPYSTPPYGEPGPWAPAPPVQHPATTPAHGTATVAPPATPTGAPVVTPPHGTPAPTVAVPPPAVPQTASPAPDPAAQAPAAAPAPAAAQTPLLPPQAPAPAVPAPRTAAPAPTDPATGAPTAPPAAPAPDPWHRYDPWAAADPATAPGAALTPAPLQQTGAAVLTERQRRRRAVKVIVVGTVLVALVSGGIGGLVGAYLERNGGVGQVELPQAGQEDAGRDADSVAGIAARALPSVVTLHVSGSGEAGTGTGFVLDGRGHILTNNHVVEPAGEDGEITVTFHDGTTAKAEVVGQDGGYDLAVVRVRGVTGMRPLPLGNSDNVQVGDPVVAIGAPFDLAGTVTSGIISAKERPITAGGEEGDASDISYVDALQTDAPINPGNSGGPLLDARAHVIGINSAIRSAGDGADVEGGQSGSIGLGFAIPINQGKRVAEELINTGRATHPVIGLTLDMGYTGDGARVGTEGSDGAAPVTPGGPGDEAGIEPGDVITEVDGQRIHSGEELIVKTRAHRPGDRLELTLRRDGEERTISLVLGSSGGA
ncbi:trypsin-like peptidase domain-containing protein [Streptomyces sp. NPDC089424]|uniref:trypsin-like peptidase domain-containing protein n=1 Tax=Streptomyces sp. NPDC089424 TaxID=3365917 RepID=UPI00382988E4